MNSILFSAKKMYDDKLGASRQKKKLAFLQILRAIVYIMDPNIEESISSICLSRDGLQVFHKVPIYLILRESTQKKLAAGKFDELS